LSIKEGRKRCIDWGEEVVRITSRSTRRGKKASFLPQRSFFARGETPFVATEHKRGGPPKSSGHLGQKRRAGS